MPHIEASTVIPLPIETVWQAHEDATLLERISAPYPVVRLVHPDVQCQVGTRLLVRVDFFASLGLDWEVEITEWTPPTQFVDEQVRGPFQSWHHVHRFEALSETETRATDAIDYEFNPAIDNTVVRWMLQTAFDLRTKTLRSVLLETARTPSGPAA
ncbi:MAG: SRPBCC family protein [Cyanobacteria bacterium J06642_2]